MDPWRQTLIQGIDFDDAAFYRALGFKCGLEIHQQLDTKKKLFCHCPVGYRNDGPDAVILRHMRPTLSEMGTYDGTALMEFKTHKQVVYHLYRDNVCTYEMDDTPPFPINQEAVDYAIEIASRAAVAGFEEIQYDYIRFPSDGKISQCRYSRKDHSAQTSAQALRDFLTLARARLKPMGVKLSICTFGLTTSVDNGMGIGQRLDQMAGLVDYVSPMMYPSHYAKGEYGLKNPNRQPYLTVHHGIKDALTRLGTRPEVLRPYLQDFSMGVRYTPAHVRAQIRAAEELGVQGWILWNAQNHYSWSSVQAGPMTKPEPEPAAAPRRKKARPEPETGADSFEPPPSPEAAPNPEVR